VAVHIMVRSQEVMAEHSHNLSGLYVNRQYCIEALEILQIRPGLVKDSITSSDPGVASSVSLKSPIASQTDSVVKVFAQDSRFILTVSWTTRLTVNEKALHAYSETILTAIHYLLIARVKFRLGIIIRIRISL
jgi:hypothetical protein